MLKKYPLLTACLFILQAAQAADMPPSVATPVGKAPSDAVVIFDGGSKEALVNGAGEALGWPVEDGALVVKKLSPQVC